MTDNTAVGVVRIVGAPALVEALLAALHADCGLSVVRVSRPLPAGTGGVERRYVRIRTMVTAEVDR
ncbi:hypothetical protein P3T37_004037 [Kitasatospora sp. MAA4]|uniref:hypothetical protein n=1 Tax=Kitasatospora sp. MAA4 TaxID=3035093 RepID=UPI002474E529|nr:hypothetical protein [Kitasatospora sp. MAA4]MDH6134633.1 hypothetical protein [Kitasatospora sp. MAA4]